MNFRAIRWNVAGHREINGKVTSDAQRVPPDVFRLHSISKPP